MKPADTWDGSRWLASSVFFLSGCVMYGVPALVRGQLYGGKITSEYPSAWVERLVPTHLQTIGNIAFFLAGAVILAPGVLRMLSDAFSEQKR